MDLSINPIYTGRGICGTEVSAYEVPEIDAGESCRVVVGGVPVVLTRDEAATLGKRIQEWADERSSR